MKHKHYICALSYNHADTTARIDWGWKRTGPREWENKLGEKVGYVSHQRDLDGLRDVILYLGFYWYDNADLGDPERFRALCRARRIQLIDECGFKRRHEHERKLTRD